MGHGIEAESGFFVWASASGETRLPQEREVCGLGQDGHGRETERFGGQISLELRTKLELQKQACRTALQAALDNSKAGLACKY